MTDHIYWQDSILYLLDQRLLPFKRLYVKCRTLRDVAGAIRNMTIRGAPLIGIVAAYGVVLGIKEVIKSRGRVLERDFDRISNTLIKTRPTAVNLSWALKRMHRAYLQSRDDPHLEGLMLNEAVSIHVEDIENNRMLSLFGAELIEDGDTILTHCNAGALAMGGYGTALGVIRAAHESGKKIKVIATETRPYLQGARLTAWELYQENIDVEVVPDNHVGILCYKGAIDKIIVGADRIALNGDTANKVGTYMLALCAHRHKIPFFVAAPISTFDRDIEDGSYIKIEERPGKEVKYIMGVPITHRDIKARYYSFDVTPHRYITNIITEKGIIKKPFKRYIHRLF
ncbi:MAG TPA: S-methyl-5-thioribose-1-phosphate isomerase [Syntrophorhabdaceae bacterium]|nr:S-methyl-5-thioribose-1-phosphate isomerase [Syntrophorhabdaceae bacterium]HOT42993.1 S-methyl-5-thioribose-1-phosphate isomerase [Syntrophorhabdaceae bacterium]HQH43435.1 S-methyl-5-thioribose-1-phosphate isomerase [Syntrophorhabdaceae bacterium]HRR70765.1 S-methyl-5-thioribose-1-phosphate isomerase [Syntrophorhabdaceae bacterium]HRV21660.1 S-methyl-5-thioribose-1-phosphate isomerase [Syntrophorhabdaceae bacterium]